MFWTTQLPAANLEDVKEKIRTKIQRITPEMFLNRTKELISQVTQGVQFEHLFIVIKY